MSKRIEVPMQSGHAWPDYAVDWASERMWELEQIGAGNIHTHGPGHAPTMFMTFGEEVTGDDYSQVMKDVHEDYLYSLAEDEVPAWDEE